MKAATIIARILLGLVFVVFGSNVWFQFLPAPAMKGPIGAMMGAMFETHYIHIIATFQVLGGLILLIGRYVPLGLTLVGPVIVNILLIHILMEPSGLPDSPDRRRARPLSPLALPRQLRRPGAMP